MCTALISDFLSASLCISLLCCLCFIVSWFPLPDHFPGSPALNPFLSGLGIPQIAPLPSCFYHTSWPVLCFLSLSQTAVSCLDSLNKHILKGGLCQPLDTRTNVASWLIPCKSEGSPSLLNLRPLCGHKGTEGATWLLSWSQRSRPHPPWETWGAAGPK